MILRRFSPEQKAAILFALARTVVCSYRAATQSLSIDEATVFLNFLRGPWARLYQHYDVNNHLLYSVLAKLCLRWFGVSEFSMRIPSLLAGFFLILGAWRVLERTVQSRPIRWAAILIIGLNPLLLDLTIAARGYGLGLALLVWAIYFAMRERDFAAGVLLGLSATAIIVMAVPGGGLIAAVFLLASGTFSARVRRALELAIPAAAIAFLISYPAFRTVNAGQFYVGESSIRASVANLVFTTIRASVTRIGLFGGGAGLRTIQYFLLPAILLFIAAVFAWVFFNKQKSRPGLIPAAAFAVCLIELEALRRIAGFNYPVERVGIYLFLLLVLAWAIAADQLPVKLALSVNGFLAGLLVLQFATQFEWRYFTLWDFDRPAKQIARILKSETGGRDADSISISASWFQTPALEFYRYHYGIGALAPIKRHDPTVLTGFDYYVLNLREDDSVKGKDLSRLIPIYRDPLSGVLLAKDPESHP